MSRGASTKPFTFSAPLTLSSADLEKKEEAIVSPIEEKGWTGHCKFILSFCAVAFVALPHYLCCCPLRLQHSAGAPVPCGEPRLPAAGPAGVVPLSQQRAHKRPKRPHEQNCWARRPQLYGDGENQFLAARGQACREAAARRADTDAPAAFAITFPITHAAYPDVADNRCQQRRDQGRKHRCRPCCR